MSKEHLIHSMDSQTSDSKNAPPVMIIVMVVLALALGSATGFFASKVFAGKTGATVAGRTANGAAASGDSTKTAGVMDTKQFKDSGEGTLKEGGIDGEGNFHLERPGGDSQNIYLTSSTIDLSTYVGKKVKVMGKTFQGQKAGWLMDVGYLEVK